MFQCGFVAPSATRAQVEVVEGWKNMVIDGQSLNVSANRSRVSRCHRTAGQASRHRRLMEGFWRTPAAKQRLPSNLKNT